MVDSTSLPTDPAALFRAIADDPTRFALFLDIDGTLLELAETPDAIVVPPELPRLLTDIAQKLGGALALVTGRALPYADALFADATLPIAGLHGAERRDFSGGITRAEPTPAFEALKRDLARQAEDWQGIIVEDKGAAVAMHFRQAPDREIDVETLMLDAADKAGADWTLQFGKMVVELRPAIASKGAAVTAFLSETPFTGRLPVAIGDDVTDEAMFSVANERGGASLRVGPAGTNTAASGSISSVADLRAALRTIVDAS